MDNGEADEPKLAVGLEGFLEGVERKVAEDSGLGVLWGPDAAQEKGASAPPTHMVDPAWSERTGWKDAARMSGGIIILASDGSPVRDSSPPDRLDEETILSIHSD